MVGVGFEKCCTIVLVRELSRHPKIHFKQRDFYKNQEYLRTDPEMVFSMDKAETVNPPKEYNRKIDVFCSSYKDKMDPTLYQELKSYYSESNEKLFKFLGRRIEGWD